MIFKDGNRDKKDVQIFVDSCTLGEIAQLGERQTEDLKVPWFNPGFQQMRPVTVCVTINNLCKDSNDKLLPCHLLL